MDKNDNIIFLLSQMIYSKSTISLAKFWSILLFPNDYAIPEIKNTTSKSCFLKNRSTTFQRNSTFDSWRALNQYILYYSSAPRYTLSRAGIDATSFRICSWSIHWYDFFQKTNARLGFKVYPRSKDGLGWVWCYLATLQKGKRVKVDG